MDVQQTSRFADRVLRLLERVEYRRADSPADKAAIYRLRHDAYMRAGTVEPKASGMFHDAMDEKDNAWLIGLFMDGELAAALRLHISASLRAPLPELASFPDLIEPHLAAGRTIIDASRFVSSLEFSLQYSEIPYLTLGPTFLAGGLDSRSYPGPQRHRETPLHCFLSTVRGTAPGAGTNIFSDIFRNVAFGRTQ